MLEMALEKLKAKGISGQKESAIAPAVAETLCDFCRQEAEFAQAVADGGSFQDCLKAVLKGVGSCISDIEVYRRAVAFYFPGAKIEMKMHIDLIGDARSGAASSTADRGIALNLEDFL